MQSFLNVTIPNGASESAAVDVGVDWHIVGVVTDAAFDGTTITFEAATRIDGTFLPVYNDNGSIYTITTGSSQWVIPDPAKLFGLRFVKLQTAIAQTGDTVVTLVREPM